MRRACQNMWHKALAIWVCILMCVSGVRLESLSEVGGGKHTRFRIHLGSAHFECIFFSHSAASTGVHEGELIDMAFTPQINEYRSNVTVQLVASALRPHDPAALCGGILRGEYGCNWAAAAYCPERADFVRIWRGMGADFTVGGTTDDVVSMYDSFGYALIQASPTLADKNLHFTPFSTPRSLAQVGFFYNKKARPNVRARHVIEVLHEYIRNNFANYLEKYPI